MKAPWNDFAGNSLYAGDRIMHPSGQTGTIEHKPDRELLEDQWVINYQDGVESRLCLQVGGKGMAVKVAP